MARLFHESVLIRETCLRCDNYHSRRVNEHEALWILNETRATSIYTDGKGITRFNLPGDWVILAYPTVDAVRTSLTLEEFYRCFPSERPVKKRGPKLKASTAAR